MMFLAGMVLITFIMLRRGYRYNRKLKSTERLDQLDKNSKVARLVPSSEKSDDSNSRWAVAMHKTERDLSGQLDTKARLVQVLLSEARRERSALEQAIRDAQRLGLRIEKSDTLSMLDEALSAPVEQMQKRLSEWDRSLLSHRQSMPHHGGGNDDVYSLADSGHTVSQIAERIGSPIGDIGLLLSLRQDASSS